MATPHIHAESSAKRFGGISDNYIEIHKLIDSSKACVSTNLHRVFTHNSFFTTIIIPKIFGEYIVLDNGKKVSTKDIAEFHILEDFGMRFIPTPQDWCEHLELVNWMNNGIGGDVPNRLKNKKEVFLTKNNKIID